MKYIYKYIILVFSIVISLSSCSKFLDLKPEDKLLEEQVFASEKYVKANLNGIYIGLGGRELYGENLTLVVPELFAHRFNITSTHNMYPFSQHRYTDATVSNTMSEIWKKSYNTIFNINRFVANLDKVAGILDAQTDSTSRGEVYAIRAMLHFDLLRMFGPMYNSVDSTLKTLPYNTSSEIVMLDSLPANVVMAHILKDLSHAERLLSYDKTMNIDKQYRFTYYSVKALQARVNLYRGDKPTALAAAKVLIANADKFPWVTLKNMNDKINADRIFSTEMIFGAYNPDLYKGGGPQERYFSGLLPEKNILAPLDARLIELYPEKNDFRFGYDQIWIKPATKLYKTFFKYADIEDKARPYRNTIPLLKLSEMYYIAAECEPNPADGIVFLNKVRYQRNLGEEVAAKDLVIELTKEYRKEFYGEGQLFYYYKRNKFTTIPRGDHATANYTMGTASNLSVKYVVPFPPGETNPRK